MTTEDLSITDVAFTVAAAGFSVACAINIMAGAEYLGTLYGVLAVALITFVQVDRNRRQTREIVNLLKKWPGRPDLPRSNDTTAAELPMGYTGDDRHGYTRPGSRNGIPDRDLGTVYPADHNGIPVPEVDQ